MGVRSTGCRLSERDEPESTCGDSWPRPVLSNSHLNFTGGWLQTVFPRISFKVRSH